MEFLIVVNGTRHGSKLSLFGEDQMRRLANLFKQVISGKTVALVSSGAQHARGCADVIMTELDLGGYSTSQTLWPDGDNPVDLPAAAELVQEYGPCHDVVILVTDHEYARKLPKYFMENVLNMGDLWFVPFIPSAVEVGHAVMVECTSGFVLLAVA